MINSEKPIQKKGFGLSRFLKTYLMVCKIAIRVAPQIFWKQLGFKVLGGLLTLPSLYITKVIIDTVISAITTHDYAGGLTTLGLMLFLQLVIRSLFDWVDRSDWVYSSSLSKAVTVDAEVKAMEKMNLLSVSDSENFENRNLYKVVRDTSGNKMYTMIAAVMNIPNQLLTIFSSMIPIISFNILIIIPGILLAIPEIIMGKKYSIKNYDFNKKWAPLYRIWDAYETFLAKGKFIYENKILAHTPILVAKIKNIADENVKGKYSLDCENMNSRSIARFPVNLYTTIINGVLFYMAIVGKVTLGSAQMVVTAISNITTSFSGLMRAIIDINESIFYVEDYSKLLDLPNEAVGGDKEISNKIENGIEFQDVWFKYPNSTDWTLKGVSFKINSQDNVAIVGENGAGKTTLIKLLCKYYQPEKGKIIFNGIDINDYSTKNYRENISALFQDFAQYPFSIRENIWFGDVSKKENLEEIQKMVKLVGLEKFVSKLPKKEENSLDNEYEGGIEPSKGQWQRIALARALYKDSQLLILDEPTSNVDPKSEEEIFNKVLTLAKDKIIFLISHRFATVRVADRILVLENGKIIEEGSHDELLKKDGRYAHLFKIQAKKYM